MKPVFTYFGHATTDLTECKIHCVDGELVAFFPKAWDVLGALNTTTAATGDPVTIKQYRVTEWESRKIGDCA